MNQILLEIFCHLYRKPSHGFLGSTLAFIIGYIAPEMEKSTIDIVVCIFQIGAFTMSMIVAGFTIYAQIHKIIDKKNHKRNCRGIKK